MNYKSLFLGLAVLLGCAHKAQAFQWGYVQAVCDALLGARQTIEELREELARLEGINDDLEAEVERLKEENDRFSANNDRLEALNANYSALNDELRGINGDLSENVAQLNASNAALSANIVSLNNEVDELKEVRQNLTEEVAGLKETREALNEEVARFSDENDRLYSLVSFLNETAGQIDASFDAWDDYLLDLIDQQGDIYIQTKASAYSEKISEHACALNINFFADDGNNLNSTEIDNAVEWTVSNYFGVDDLCLSSSNFEVYVTVNKPMTLSEYASVFQDYANMAENHYFNSSKFNWAMWRDAGFSCGGLTPFLWIP